jgi:hypothetical protein
MFVKSIQKTLLDQHKVDQEAHNCGTKECYAKCSGEYEGSRRTCEARVGECHVIRDDHEACRDVVYDKYKVMAKACAELHCFEPPLIDCTKESCICKDVASCSMAQEVEGAYGGKTVECPATEGDCESDPKKGYGAFLQSTITKFVAAHSTWAGLHKACTVAYRDFLHVDIDCDGVQKKFETCMCSKSMEEEWICSHDFSSCNEKCRDLYEESVPNLQCQEKDRKIDWSATKKIECYLDVLLHDYSEKELLDKCGTKDCISTAREKDYKHCSTICPNVDHDGHWGEVQCDDTGSVKAMSHETRKHHDQYHLGDLEGGYKCDFNGPHVHTNHRGGKKRVEEERCTEHLDIDYQVPRWQECEPPQGVVCDADFHCKYYAKFDDTTKIDCISDCCPEGGGGCHPDVNIKSCGTDAAYSFGETYSSLKTIWFGEHTHAWAYNRCPCTYCHAKTPSYPAPASGRGKCTGVHTKGFGIREPRTVTVTSKGTKDLPHCSWESTCKWGKEEKDMCAETLCKAAGYSTGKFSVSSNDICKESFVDGKAFFVITDKEAKIVEGPHRLDAQVTAECLEEAGRGAYLEISQQVEYGQPSEDMVNLQ